MPSGTSAWRVNVLQEMVSEVSPLAIGMLQDVGNRSDEDCPSDSPRSKSQRDG
jgi:hypothetical protein